MYAVGLLALALLALSPTGSGLAASGLAIRVQGNQLVDVNGRGSTSA
jgi:hypothetical protein